MALNSTGPLSLGGSTVGQSINLELGQAATALASINATNFRTLAGVASGQISVSNFYGKSNTPGGWSFSTGNTTPFQLAAAYVDTSNYDIYVSASLDTFTKTSPFKFNASGTQQWGVTFTDANQVRTPYFAYILNGTSYYTDGSVTICSLNYTGSGAPNGWVTGSGTIQRFNSSGTRLFGYSLAYGFNSQFQAFNEWYGKPARNASYTALPCNIFTQWAYCCCGQQFVETACYSAITLLNSSGGIINGYWANSSATSSQLFTPAIDSSNNVYVNSFVTNGQATCNINKFPAANPGSGYTGVTIYNSGVGQFYQYYGTMVAAGTYVWAIGQINASVTNKGYQLYIIRISSGGGNPIPVNFGKYLVAPVRNSIQQSSCVYGATGVGNSANGDLYIASRANSGQGLYGLICKYDVNGTLQWSRDLRLVSSTIPSSYTGSSSVYVASIQLDTTNSVVIVAGWFQVGDSGGSNTRSQGFALRLPIDGSKTGNITIPYPPNTAYSTIFSYADSGATDTSLGVTTGTFSNYPVNNTGNFYSQSYSPTTTSATASGTTVSF